MEEEEKQEQPTQPKSKMPLIVGGIVGVVAIIVGAVFFLMGDTLFGGEKEKVKEEPASNAVYYELPDILVNLYNPNSYRTSKLLRLKLYLELENKEDLPHFTALQIKILDQFQFYLRGLKIKDISGSTGLQRLKEELTNLANTAAEPRRIKNVLFREMLIQ